MKSWQMPLWPLLSGKGFAGAQEPNSLHPIHISKLQGAVIIRLLSYETYHQALAQRLAQLNSQKKWTIHDLTGKRRPVSSYSTHSSQHMCNKKTPACLRRYGKRLPAHARGVERGVPRSEQGQDSACQLKLM